MSRSVALLRQRFDRLGILLSALCAIHCSAGLALVALLGMGGSLLFDPAIHHVGLAAAVAVGTVAIGMGVARHRRGAPVLLAGAGMALMALALAAGHGPAEAWLTIAGVALVALAHWRNLRHLAG